MVKKVGYPKYTIPLAFDVPIFKAAEFMIHVGFALDL